MPKEKAMEEFCSLVEKIAPELEAYLEAQCRDIEEKRRKKQEEEQRKREEEEQRRREEEERLERERLLKIEEQKRREEAEREEQRFGSLYITPYFRVFSFTCGPPGFYPIPPPPQAMGHPKSPELCATTRLSGKFYL